MLYFDLFDLFFLLKFAFERIVLCPRSPGALLLWSSPLNFDGAVEVSLLGLQVIVILQSGAASLAVASPVASCLCAGILGRTRRLSLGDACSHSRASRAAMHFFRLSCSC